MVNRQGAGYAAMWTHRKGPATRPGALEDRPPGRHPRPPWGVVNAYRWLRIARASPPARETGMAILRDTEL